VGKGRRSAPELSILSRSRCEKRDQRVKLTASGNRFRVLDDFLEDDDLKSIRHMMATLKYERVPSVVDPEADGDALRSRGAVLRHDAASKQGPPGTPGSLPGAYAAVLRELRSHADLFGPPGEGWSIIGMSFWRYAAGNRLGWHNDADSVRRGEFILFLHDEWRASWAGELLLLDTDPDTLGLVDEEPSLPASVEAKVSQAHQCLVAIVPRPNRLVLVKAGTIHCIQRVDRTAGETLRQTMTGFIASDPPGRRSVENHTVERLAALLGAE
jgi:hypothetical protein